MAPSNPKADIGADKKVIAAGARGAALRLASAPLINRTGQENSATVWR
jgi:hypothetical protein